MKNLEEIRERYLKEPFNRRLGHLASDLARISAFLDNPDNIKTVDDILEESKFFIEWTAPSAPSNLQAFFSEIQPKLALYQIRLLRNKDRKSETGELKKMTKTWSMKLIEFSGLLA